MNRIEDNTIFIGNLGYKTTEKTLEETFRTVGNVIHVNIVYSNGRPKGVAFVEFETHEQAINAIEQFDQKEVDGRKVFLKLASDPAPPKKRDLHEPRERHREEGFRERDFDRRRDDRDNRRPHYDNDYRRDHRCYPRDMGYHRLDPRLERDRRLYDIYEQRRKNMYEIERRERDIAASAAAIAVQQTLATAFGLTTNPLAGSIPITQQALAAYGLTPEQIQELQLANGQLLQQTEQTQ